LKLALGTYFFLLDAIRRHRHEHGGKLPMGFRLPPAVLADLQIDPDMPPGSLCLIDPMNRPQGAPHYLLCGLPVRVDTRCNAPLIVTCWGKDEPI